MSLADPDAAVLIGIGANLPSPVFGPPLATCEAALLRLEAAGVSVAVRSPWYRTEPRPASDQPWFVNAVAALTTELAPAFLLALLHRLENAAGRERPFRWAPRVLDIDLLAYGRVVSPGDPPPALPHPRMHERAFVLRPLADLAPDWRHPVTGRTVSEMLATLDDDGACVPLAASGT